eukprot:2949478-Pleurochrysis_carterae.AAC.1
MCRKCVRILIATIGERKELICDTYSSSSRLRSRTNSSQSRALYKCAFKLASPSLTQGRCRHGWQSVATVVARLAPLPPLLAERRHRRRLHSATVAVACRMLSLSSPAQRC